MTEGYKTCHNNFTINTKYDKDKIKYIKIKIKQNK